MKIEKFKNQKFTTGFTLIELMVSVSIFLIVAFVVTSVFITALDAYRKAKQISFLVDNLNYAFDRMVINLREGTDYGVSGNPPGTRINFKDLEDNPHIYSLFSNAEDGDREYIIECTTNTDPLNCSQLTDKKIDINKLTFTLMDTPPANSVRPPMVRINAQSTITQRNIVTTINLQTTVTQRNSD